jgi:hypothetical protein
MEPKSPECVRRLLPKGGNVMWLQLWTVTIALAVGLAGIAMTLPDDA